LIQTARSGASSYHLSMAEIPGLGTGVRSYTLQNSNVRD